VTPNESLQFAISDWTHQWDVPFQSFYTPNNVFALNTWSHVAAVYDQPAGARRIYVNGVEVAERIDPPITVTNTTARVGIGANLFSSTGSRGYFDGLIDELSFYSAALSTADLQAIYNAGAAGKCPPGMAPLITAQPASQTVLAGSAATFSVTATGTPPLSYQWRFSGSNIAGATGSSLTLTNVQPAQAGIYAVQVMNAYGSTNSADALLTVTPRPCAPPPPGLISWWQGEGTALDSAGTNNGSLPSGVVFAVGKVGQAFDFNGTSQYVDVPNSAGLNPTASISLEAWIYPRLPLDPVGSPIIKKGGEGLGQQDGYTLEFSGTSGVVFAVNVNGTVWWLTTDPAPVPFGAWSHVAGVYDGTNVSIYVNGLLVSRTPGANPAPIVPSGNNLQLGHDPSNPSRYFNGLVDEASVYNTALSAAQIQAIYNAGAAGKCTTATPPSILIQPASQTAWVGANVTFGVTATGAMPLSYQWQFNGTNVSGGTEAFLVLTNVQFVDAGTYSVMVSNPVGTATSSNATLTVAGPPPCVGAPAGLISWWRGENNGWDQQGVNPATLQNGVAFAQGEVGEAFDFNGTSQYLNVPSNATLNPTASISVEAWIYPRLPLNAIASPIIKKAGEGMGQQDGYSLELAGTQGVVFSIYVGGGRQWVATAPAPVPMSQWSHVAGVYDGMNISIYVNGVLVGTPVAGPGQIVPSGNNLQIGHDPSNASRYFNGLVDEASVYSTALSAAQIQAIYIAGAGGKCIVSTPPSIIVQPANQVVTVGGSVTFSLAVGGTPPLSYQWSFGGSALDGATNATLTLTNVQFSQAGDYSVVITNVAGTASSSNATLSVNFPPASVRVVSVTNAQSGATVNVPVALAANGNENGLSFSLNFDTTKLTYVSTALGSGASGANLLTNAAQAANGKLGVILALPPNQTFAAGTQELVEVTFMTAVRTIAFSTTVSFGDIPIVRELSDAPGNVLAATYASGSVLIQAANFEGDLAPRPNGDKAVTVTDWVLAGRYAARLDYPTNAAEFQRADCAPRATLGDGAITVIDWVQVGLYAAGLDPLTVAGGPTSEVPPGGGYVSKPGSTPVTPHGDSPYSRLLEVADTVVLRGLTGTASVQLEAMGDENALGFSLGFDPAAVTYVGASIGSASNGVTLIVNDTQAGAGRLGFVLGLGAGSSFVSGTRELVKVTFRAATPDQGKYTLSFADQPVPCEVSGTNALPLATGYVNGTITVNPLPSLSIGRSGDDITLAWPLWATNFGLQVAEGGLPPAVPWTNLVAVPALTTNQAIVTLPLAPTNRLYRLHQQ
jgi:hypothetical protein